MNEIKLKNEVRKRYIKIRKNIEDKELKSKIITEKIIQSDVYKNATIVALYKNLKSEVDTNLLIEYSIRLGKTIVLPKITNETMEFYKIDSINEQLIKSKFGVEEPSGEKDNLINKENIDLIIVPGVCFDKEKNRMGFGKGYYDKYLENSNLITIGICFSEQILDKLPVTANDIKMEQIITDTFILT